MTLSEPPGRTVHREAIGTNNFGKYKIKVILKGVCIISLHNYFKTVYLKSISETILTKIGKRNLLGTRLMALSGRRTRTNLIITKYAPSSSENSSTILRRKK